MHNSIVTASSLILLDNDCSSVLATTRPQSQSSPSSLFLIETIVAEPSFDILSDGRNQQNMPHTNK